MTKTKKEYTAVEWEVLSQECEDCGHFSDNPDTNECSECGSENVVPEWNYEGMDCKSCKRMIEIETDAYSEDDGDFEDVICSSCFAHHSLMNLKG